MDRFEIDFTVNETEAAFLRRELQVPSLTAGESPEDAKIRQNFLAILSEAIDSPGNVNTLVWTKVIEDQRPGGGWKNKLPLSESWSCLVNGFSLTISNNMSPDLWHVTYGNGGLFLDRPLDSKSALDAQKEAIELLRDVLRKTWLSTME